jgi:hypothetical protein
VAVGVTPRRYLPVLRVSTGQPVLEAAHPRRTDVTETFIVVDGVRATRRDRTNLRNPKDLFGMALDQRAFGPGRLLVAFANRRGRLRAIAHAPRTDPPERALEACIQHLGAGATHAVAYCDEPVTEGPPPEGLYERFALACSIADRYGIELADWIACDDQWYRSTRLALFPDDEWWPE